MSFYKKVENTSDLNDQVPVLESYLPNSIIYITLYCLAVPPNILLAYMGLKKGLISARVKYPTLGMTIATLYGLFGFLMLNSNVLLYDYIFTYIRMSPYTNVFVFFVLAPSFFIFSFICDLLVLSSIVRRQSKAARKQSGRSLNPRHLQQQKAIVYTYILQAFMPLVLATPYYIANLFLMCSIDIDMIWFTIGEAIIGIHPLSNALINLILLRPYRRALRKMWVKNESKNVQYDSITIANTHFMDGDCFL
uniref:Uncharacterized protein n=3 Tax=Wuchereria bancrofti TaxID=6293 RepID=A0AAF5PYC2_WUCBA